MYNMYIYIQTTVLLILYLNRTGNWRSVMNVVIIFSWWRRFLWLGPSGWFLMWKVVERNFSESLTELCNFPTYNMLLTVYELLGSDREWERERGREGECDRGKEKEIEWENASQRRQLSLGIVPTQSIRNIHQSSAHIIFDYNIIFDWISRQRGFPHLFAIICARSLSEMCYAKSS